MIAKSLLVAATMLLSAASGIALAQNGPRGNRGTTGQTCPRADCPNPGQNCPRNGSGPRVRAGWGRTAEANTRSLATTRDVGRGAGIRNCPRR